MAPRSPRALGDDPDSVVALVVHKPRGHVSERFPPGVSRDPLGRPSAYELLPRSLDPGAPSLGAVGRLDAETSGLLVFTSSPALNLALRAGGVAKTYVATVGARRLSDARLARAVASAEIPLTRRDDDRAPDAEAWTKPATARLLGRRVARRLAEDAAEDAATDAATEPPTRPNLQSDRTSAATEPPTREPLPPASAASRVGDPFAEPFAAEEHWRRHRACALGLRASDDLLADRFEVAEVEIATRDGKFHQVRRLVRRAGLKMRHLRRTRVGPVGMEGVDAPGAWRELTGDEIEDILRRGGGGGRDREAGDGADSGEDREDARRRA